MSTSATTHNHNNLRIIDSHLHVWADSSQSVHDYPYAQQPPPDSLRDAASTDQLLAQMADAGVEGALIVQPINHQYDHSYVLHEALQQHPTKFKGMLLHNPQLSAQDAVAQLEDLALQGFVGVRFNPYLWPKLAAKADDGNGDNTDDNKPALQWQPMSEGAGLAVYKRCAELHMPVGIMCFQGLDLHYDDILQLLEQSPDTTLILDHFAFASVQETARAQANFEKLLSLARYPAVNVKISALFRLDDADTNTFDAVRRQRFEPLLKAFGAQRLLYGSDFPYLLDQTIGYRGAAQLVASSWMKNHSKEDRAQVMAGTAERLFGPWGYAIGSSSEPPPVMASCNNATEKA